MNISYKVFNEINEELRSVGNAISPNCVQTREERINTLDTWKEIRWTLFYNDKSNLMYEKSTTTNLLEKELNENRRYLRDSGLNIQDFKQELLVFITSFLEPLQANLLKGINQIEAEIQFIEKDKPENPEGYDDILPGVDCSMFPDNYRIYQEQYSIWKTRLNEAENYNIALNSFEDDLSLIEQTIKTFTSSINQEYTNVASSTNDSDNNKKPKRINNVAKEKHNRIIAKYQEYIRCGSSHTNAIQALVHDFRTEYSPHSTSYRKKHIQYIIRKGLE